MNATTKIFMNYVRYKQQCYDERKTPVSFSKYLELFE